MAKLVCVDALVYLDGTEVVERNEASISWDVDIATARPFVPSLSAAFENQTATWKSASITLNGWYDDSDFTLIDNAIASTTSTILVYPTRSDTSTYWSASVVINSLEHTITSEDYSELNADMSVDGALTFTHP